MKKIVTAQKNISQVLKKKALELEVSYNKDLLLYRKNQELLSKRSFVKSHFQTLMNCCLKSHVIYLGDFHTYDQPSKNALRIIKYMLQKGKSLTIGLEIITVAQEEHLQSYLKNQITELEFLEVINYKESWRFPWTHYKELLQIAKKNKISIIALNSKGSLQNRDQFASLRIAQYLKKNKDRSLIVFFGEYHICPNKIPKLLLNNYQAKIEQVIVHQNLDYPYWQLHKKGQDLSKIEIIKFSRNEFCLLNSPPWMKYESMIYWFEQFTQDPDYDLHEIIIKKGIKLISDDSADNLIAMMKVIINYLGIKNTQNWLEDFNLIGHQKINHIEKVISEIENKKYRTMFKLLIHRYQSFYLPKQKTLYLPNYSINRLAKLSGNVVFHHITDQTPFQKYLTSNKKLDFFNYFFLVHLYSSLFAKIINPYLKCDLYGDLKYKIKNLKSTSEFNLVIQLLDHPRKINEIIKSAKYHQIYSVSKTIGELISHYYWLDHLKNNKMEILSLYQDSIYFKIHSKYLANENFKNEFKRIL